MSRIGAYLLAIVLAGCTLVDPLDDISGQTPDAGIAPIDAGPTARDAGTNTNTDAGTSDAGIGSLLNCAAAETEPNDTPFEGTPLGSGVTMCGFLNGSDTDVFSFGPATPGTWKVRVDATAVVNAVLLDTDKLPAQINFKSGETRTGEMSAGAVLQITLTVPAGATQVGYAVTLTLSP